MNCRHCKILQKHVFLDLGFAPPSNNYLTGDQLYEPETYFPLRLFVCENCWLVQTDDYSQSKDLFTAEYAYFSSVSQTWLAHAADFSKQIQQRLHLDKESFVIEVASNDGYLLRNFVEAKIPCLGIEPTASTAAAAEALGIPVLREFFSQELATKFCKSGQMADLIIGNNVYAHVPDINDFTAGLKTALKPNGTITLEFPHLKNILQNTQFDTIYHEHFSYLSLQTAIRIFETVGLRIFDVEELSTHGGSLRVFGCHSGDIRATTLAVTRVIEAETQAGLRNLQTFKSFQLEADRVKDELLAFLIHQKKMGRKVAAYGAAAKGNTFLNYAGIKRDLVRYVCDAAPSKHGKYLPGSHIPIVEAAYLQNDKPDFVLVLPWNIASEVTHQLSFVRGWGGRFIVAIPSLNVF